MSTLLFVLLGISIVTCIFAFWKYATTLEPGWMTLWLVVFVSAIVLLIVVLVLASKKHATDNEVDLVNCEVIGSALDRGHYNGKHYNKIFKCHDGTMHIR